MGEAEEFNPLTFEKRLTQLKDTQESIQSLSSWCLKQREHHKKIVASWLNVLKRVKVEQRLVLFYLANDVIQYSKRKNYQFVESWGLNLQKATPLVRDEKVRHKILRIFKIWEQRSVYDDEFLSDLTGLLSAGAIKKTDDDPLDFQPQQLVNKIKQCTVLEADTDLRLKYIHESHLQLSDSDALCASLKDRSNKDDVEKELGEGIQCVERYTAALQREIVAREALLVLLSTANQYYSTQRGEVKVVAYAYKNFGARVRALKRKLDELIPNLPSAAPSPPRDEDVPSPGPDEDLDLPAPPTPPDNELSYNIDRTFSTSISADGSLYNLGLSSFLSTDNSVALFESDNNSANKIEVINSRPNEKQDFDINNFLKTLVPNDSNPATLENSNSGSATVAQMPGADECLPGLDLLADAPRPPVSFYGTMNNLNDDNDAYQPEMPSLSQWNNNQWSIQPTPVPPPAVSVPMVPPPLPIPVSHPPTLSIPVSHPSMNPLVSHSPLNPPLNQSHPLNPPLHGLNPPLHGLNPSSHQLNPQPHGINPPSHPLNPPPHQLNPPQHPLNPPTHPLNPPSHSLNPPSHPLNPAPLGITRPMFDTPESPPPAPPPPPAPIVPVYTHNTPELPPADVDHRGILPPPPPPPVLPLLGNMEDVDHRLLPPPPPPATTAPNRHPSGQQDVDHRNLISLTNQPPPARAPAGSRDQDYRVPPVVAPSDIVESVDMDLSEDDESQAMYQNEHRRHTFNNNNKVLVGGDNGKTNHSENQNLRPISIERETERPHTAPIIPPMTNPFDNMPIGLKNINMTFNNSFPQTHEPPQNNQYPEENSNDSAYEDDSRNRGVEQPQEQFEIPDNFNEYQQRPFNNQRFPRNWGPRTMFRPPFPPQMWPRNGPRPPNRWMGPRPRFW